MSDRHKAALGALVKALQDTNWSSWQSTAMFYPALRAAIGLLESDRLRDSSPDLLAALEKSQAEADALRDELGRALSSIETMRDGSP